MKNHTKSQQYPCFRSELVSGSCNSRLPVLQHQGHKACLQFLIGSNIFFALSNIRVTSKNNGSNIFIQIASGEIVTFSWKSIEEGFLMMKRCRLSRTGDDDDIFPLSPWVPPYVSRPPKRQTTPTFHHLPPRKNTGEKHSFHIHNCARSRQVTWCTLSGEGSANLTVIFSVFTVNEATHASRIGEQKRQPVSLSSQRHPSYFLGVSPAISLSFSRSHHIFSHDLIF